MTARDRHAHAADHGDEADTARYPRADRTRARGGSMTVPRFSMVAGVGASWLAVAGGLRFSSGWHGASSPIAGGAAVSARADRARGSRPAATAIRRYSPARRAARPAKRAERASTFSRASSRSIEGDPVHGVEPPMAIAHLPQVAEIGRRFPLSLTISWRGGAWRDRILGGIGSWRARIGEGALAAVAHRGSRRGRSYRLGGRCSGRCSQRLVLQDAVDSAGRTNAVDAPSRRSLVWLSVGTAGRTVVAVRRLPLVTERHFRNPVAGARAGRGRGGSYLARAQR